MFLVVCTINIKINSVVAFIQNEQSASNSDVVCENGVCKMKESQPSTSSETTAAPVDSSSENILSTEEKAERAKELIEQKREAKDMEEKEVCQYIVVFISLWFTYTICISVHLSHGILQVLDKSVIIR